MRVNWICLVFFCGSMSLQAANGSFSMSTDEQAIVNLTNAERQKAGQRPLKPNPILFDVARKHAADMAAEQKLEHRMHGKNSSDRVQAAGYKWTVVSENIAWNQRSVGEVMTGWMHSKGHRENLLGPDIVDIGVGVATNSAGEPYWVQVFAKPEAGAQNYSAEPATAVMTHTVTAATTFAFSIQNLSGAPVEVDVHTEKTFVIQPGETTQYTLTTPSAKPLVEVKEGVAALEFIVKNGAKYTVNAIGDEIELSQKNPQGP